MNTIDLWLFGKCGKLFFFIISKDFDRVFAASDDIPTFLLHLLLIKKQKIEKQTVKKNSKKVNVIEISRYLLDYERSTVVLVEIYSNMNGFVLKELIKLLIRIGCDEDLRSSRRL